MDKTWQSYLAEGIGTFIFVFAAAGSVLANAQSGGSLGVVGVALAHALALAAVIYTVWHVSGAHLNPAVTIALWATKHVKTLTAVGYITAQLVGGIVAALLLKIIFSDVSPQFYLGDTMLAPGVSPVMGIFIEAVFTFFLTWAVFGAAVDKRASLGFGALAIGFVLGMCLLVGGHFTMMALNPARSFGPALVSAHWENHYVYWIGPILGALVAGFVYTFGLGKK